MNTFLQGCCFTPPEDDNISTPSFIGHQPHLVPLSRPSSKTDSSVKSLDDKEIIYVKPYPGDAWRDFDEERTRVNSSASTASSGAFTKSSKSTPSSRRTYRGCSKTPLIVPEDKKIMCHLCQSGRHRSGSSYASAYEPTTPSRCRPTSTGKLLDFISMCLWKCTPGCQQIPTINT